MISVTMKLLMTTSATTILTVRGQEQKELPTKFQANFADGNNPNSAGILELEFDEDSLMGSGNIKFDKSTIQLALKTAASTARNKAADVSTDQTEKIALNLSAYKAENCEITTGLAYHIHTAWMHEDSMVKFGGVQCGKDFTSGHYDPVGEIGTENCIIEKGAALPDNVNTICELGDLSNKFGSQVDATTPVDTSINVTIDFDDTAFLDQVTMGEFVDSVNGNTDHANKLSIVFHACGNRFACAQIVSAETSGCYRKTPTMHS